VEIVKFIISPYFLSPSHTFTFLCPYVYSYMIRSSPFLRRFAGSTGVQVLTFLETVVSTLWWSRNSS